MGELLTSLDVVNQRFKKVVMGGYDTAEVDDYLDRIAEVLQSYAQRMKDYELSVSEQSSKLLEYDNIKASINDTLLMAQKTASEKLGNANTLADQKMSEAVSYSATIIEDAKARAANMIIDAKASIQSLIDEIGALKELRAKTITSIRDFLADVADVADRAEAGGGINLPSMAAASVRDDIPPAIEYSETAQRHAQGHNDAPDPEREPEPKKERKPEASEVLSILGIDASLLDTGV
ncbi:hypothetical protein FACS1894216_15290 [Synergistales bacterium]|nr:hypothetical protein FACS1894216_15290 [Synergistales bacterium]